MSAHRLYKIVPGTTLILASTSPRRRQMFAELGLECEVAAPEVDEEPHPGEGVRELVLRLAAEKSTSVQRRFPGSWCLGADTVVEYNGVMFGKPSDPIEAVKFLSVLQGVTHKVWGGIAVVLPSGEVESKVSCSEVKLATLDDQTIQSYVATGEPLDKAGSYAVQGLGAAFVERVTGSYTNVVGLDLALCMEILIRRKVVQVLGSRE